MWTPKTRRITKTIGKLAGYSLMAIGLIDVPGQIDRWLQLLRDLAAEAPAFLTGNGGRWAVFLVGFVVTLLSYDGPRQWIGRRLYWTSAASNDDKATTTGKGFPGADTDRLVKTATDISTSGPRTLIHDDQFDLSVIALDNAFVAIVKNEDPAKAKGGIALVFDDLQKWSAEKKTFFEVPEIAQARKPMPIRRFAGEDPLYFERKQEFWLFDRAESRGDLLFTYTDQHTTHKVNLGQGTWVVRITLAWKSDVRPAEFFVRWGAGEVPQLVPDPREASA